MLKSGSYDVIYIIEQKVFNQIINSHPLFIFIFDIYKERK